MITCGILVPLFYMVGFDWSGGAYSSPSLCSWKLHEHAHGDLTSICAHESFMSMLMKLSCARARGEVTWTTTLGQYAPGILPGTDTPGHKGLKKIKWKGRHSKCESSLDPTLTVSWNLRFIEVTKQMNLIRDKKNLTIMGVHRLSPFS